MLRRNKGRHSKINQKCPFLGGNSFFEMRSKEREKKRTNKTKQGGLRAKWGGPSGHLTWPLNPHKTNPPPPKKQKKEKGKTQKKHKNTKKRAFQLSANFSFCLVGVQNFPFFDNLAKKVRVTKRPFLGPKRPQTRNPRGKCLTNWFGNPFGGGGGKLARTKPININILGGTNGTVPGTNRVPSYWDKPGPVLCLVAQ